MFVSLTQLREAPAQRDFSLCPTAEACGEPNEIPEGYDKFLGEWRCGAGYAGTAAIGCSPRRNCQSTATLSGCVPIEPCLPIIPGPEDCDLNVSACQSVLGGESCEISCKDPPYRGASTIATCPEGNINTSQVLTWTRPKCELTNCIQRVDIPDGYVKDSVQKWICAPGYIGTPNVECKINVTTDDCEAYCLYEGCFPEVNCTVPAVDACRLNFTECHGIL
ncbi:unnamed protein product [Durusdinium trenchii]|uniref:Sushi domain-containing protein n=1 Tax=Durusdinium trenchii TaxID=1381693 RepID=A0ABP0JWP5_9DINO